MISQRVSFTLVLALVCVPAAHAGGNEAGTAAASFLTLGSGAGYLGMGGAALGASDGLAAAGWNVAALGWQRETEMLLSHASLPDQSVQEWAAVGGPLGHWRARWALTGLYRGEGSIEGRDAFNTSTGSFSVSSIALGARLARPIGALATVGLGVQYVREDLGTVAGSGATLDGGVQVRAGDFGIGLAAQNVGGRMSYDGTFYPFPANVGVGASYAVPGRGLRLALDANFPRRYYSDVRGGAEWTWRERVALRAGYRAELGAPSNDALSGPSFGMGTGVGAAWFDYGYLISGLGESQHRLSISFLPGRMGGVAQRAAEVTAPRHAATAAPSRVQAPAAAAPERERERATPATGTAAPARTAAVPAAPAAPPETPAAKPAAPPRTAAMAPASASAPPAAAPATAMVAPKTAPSTTPAPATVAAAPAAASPAPSAVTPAAPAAAPAPKPAAPAPPAETPAPATATAAPKTAASARETVAPAAETPPAAPAAPQPASPASDRATAASRPGSAPAGSVGPAPARPAPARPRAVKVKAGDTLRSMARAYGTSVEAIMYENNLTSDRIRVGQSLKLPAPR